MENILNKKTYVFIESVRILTGILAIVVTGTLGLFMIIVVAVAFAYNDRQAIAYILCFLSLIVAMILFAVYVWGFYGRKKCRLLRISFIALAGYFISLVIVYSPNIIYSLTNNNYSRASEMTREDTVTSCTYLLLAIICIFSTIKSKKTHFNIRYISIIAILTSLVFVISFIWVSSRTDDLLFHLLTTSPLLPFVMFGLFCPPTHERVRK